jgi:hypothetical protein
LGSCIELTSLAQAYLGLAQTLPSLAQAMLGLAHLLTFLAQEFLVLSQALSCLAKAMPSIAWPGPSISSPSKALPFQALCPSIAWALLKQCLALSKH